MTQDQHYDVASYALGILDDRDAARFEDHLIECAQCAYELESFVEVADVLSTVDGEAFVAAEQAERDASVLHKMLGEVGAERQRANSRRLYSLAAAVVAFTMLSIGALFAGGQWLGSGSGSTPETTAQGGGQNQLDPLPNGDLGLGGTKLPGDNYTGTDSRSNVSAIVGLLNKDYGTQISFAVGGIEGAKTCALYVVRTDGTKVKVSDWTVPAGKGWGTAANPAPLMLQAATSIPKDQIAHVQVEEVSASGSTSTLVRVP
ncbi:MAG TPA: zf-HC2 domain-containing protein [Actinoplanes sp.]|nr:zf-HC2 domain-containing protein [Actinoplanes sp.]